MTEEQILALLIELAQQRFGELRAKELLPDIRKTAEEISALQRFSIAIEDAA